MRVQSRTSLKGFRDEKRFGTYVSRSFDMRAATTPNGNETKKVRLTRKQGKGPGSCGAPNRTLPCATPIRNAQAARAQWQRSATCLHGLRAARSPVRKGDPPMPPSTAQVYAGLSNRALKSVPVSALAPLTPGGKLRSWAGSRRINGTARSPNCSNAAHGGKTRPEHHGGTERRNAQRRDRMVA